MPINYSLVQAIEKFDRFLGEDFKVPVPCLDGRESTRPEIPRYRFDLRAGHPRALMSSTVFCGSGRYW